MEGFVGIICASSLCRQIIASMQLKSTIGDSFLIALFRMELRILESKTMDSISKLLQLNLDSELLLQGMFCNS